MGYHGENNSINMSYARHKCVQCVLSLVDFANSTILRIISEILFAIHMLLVYSIVALLLVFRLLGNIAFAVALSSFILHTVCVCITL